MIIASRHISIAAYGLKFHWHTIHPCRVRAEMTVTVLPKIQLAADVGQVEEHFHVQALAVQLSVEAFEEAILRRLHGRMKPMYTPLV